MAIKNIEAFTELMLEVAKDHESYDLGEGYGYDSTAEFRKDDPELYKFIKSDWAQIKRAIPSIVRYMHKVGALDLPNPWDAVYDDWKDLNGKTHENLYYDQKCFNRFGDSDVRSAAHEVFRDALEKAAGKFESKSAIRSSVARMLGESTKKPACKAAKKEDVCSIGWLSNMKDEIEGSCAEIQQHILPQLRKQGASLELLKRIDSEVSTIDALMTLLGEKLDAPVIIESTDTEKAALLDELLKVLADYETPAHSRIAKMQILCNKHGIDYTK